MEVSSSHQIMVFFIYVISGFICGTFFDVQRLFRKMFKADVARTSIEDLIFAVFTVFMAIAPGMIFNNGEMRYYQIIGILCGGVIYAVVLSRVISRALYFLFWLANKILIIPIVRIYGVLTFPFKKVLNKMRQLKNIEMKAKKKLSRHLKRKRKTVKKRIKML